MNMRLKYWPALALGVVLLCPTTTSAQLLSGYSQGGSDQPWLTDVRTGDFAVIPGIAVSGLAADDSNRLLFVSDGSKVTTISYSNGIGNQSRVNEKALRDLAGKAVRYVYAMGFGNSTLYGFSGSSASATTRSTAVGGLYQIDPSTGVCTLRFAKGSISALGMDFNSLDGLLYFAGSVGGTQGLYSLNPNSGATALVATYPANATNSSGRFSFDGVAVGDGKVFLTSGDESAPILVFDLASKRFLDSLLNPPRNEDVGGGGATFAASLAPR